jgi:hypothetical protein
VDCLLARGCPSSSSSDELIAYTKDVTATGSFGVWFGLDPTDAPLLLRDAGTQDIYASVLNGSSLPAGPQQQQIGGITEAVCGSTTASSPG